MKSEKYIPALSYDWLTPFYDPIVRLTTRERIFKTALVNQSNIKAGHHVLDLACGTGTLTMMLKERSPNAEIIGIDGDAKILQIAKEKANQLDLEIRFDEGMAFSLPYPDESFDRVVSSLFFHHLTRENKLKTLYEVKRVLKPQGSLHVADWGMAANPMMKLMSRVIQFLDGFETTADSFGGMLPEFLTEAEFNAVEETGSFNTLFGTLRLHEAFKKQKGDSNGNTF
ncbi:MAG: class I SAM-dependent methyltransferase [Acidobacteriota bacterium]